MSRILKTIVLASGNSHKAQEVESWLRTRGLPIKVQTASEFGGMSGCIESADSFEGNAKIKVDFLRERVPSDFWVLADDSGLVVDALDGAPGVFSARFAGEDATDEQNVELLLERMRKFRSARQRSGRFVCALSLSISERGRESFLGECNGSILSHPRGENGFGYDPVFLPEGFSKSFAEMKDEEKNRLSHRAKALEGFEEFLRRT